MHHVLVVDDDPQIQTLLVELLSAEGIPTVAAADGVDALAAVAERRPAVILLDMDMPRMDGPQFCRELAARLGREDTAIVVMTASDRVAEFRAVCAAEDVLPKPFDIDALIATVTRHLSPPVRADN